MDWNQSLNSLSAMPYRYRVNFNSEASSKSLNSLSAMPYRYYKKKVPRSVGTSLNSLSAMPYRYAVAKEFAAGNSVLTAFRLCRIDTV